MKNGYVVGIWPPFHRGKSSESARLMLRFARAHVAAYKVLHEVRNDACVGFAHSAPYIIPCSHGGWRDKLAAKARDTALNDLFFWLVRATSAMTTSHRAFDFIGLNYYTRSIVRSAPGVLGRLFGLECRERHHEDLGPANELGWQVYAPGLYEVARRFSSFGVPLIITENGLATEDDEQRAVFIRQHIEQVARALKDGIDIRGYLYWTLMDNFEWAYGTTAHFGLADVDACSLNRIPRPSSAVFAEICGRNAVYVSRESAD
jgi:beta-glucosidase